MAKNMLLVVIYGERTMIIEPLQITGISTYHKLSPSTDT
jgi:hypothetical protein